MRIDVYNCIYVLCDHTSLVNIVIVQWYVMQNRYLPNKWHEKEIYLFDDNLPTAKDPVPPSLSLPRLHSVHVRYGSHQRGGRFVTSFTKT